MKRLVGIVLMLACAGVAARADSIILVGTVVVSPFGFGVASRALTIQSHSPSSPTEQGCISPGLTMGAAACAPVDALVGGNEAPPLGFPKQAAPTLASLGITSGSQIGILFDAIQPDSSGNDIVTINDLTLKLYNGSTLIYSVSGTFAPLGTNPGNGKSDYLFTLDPAAVAAFNAALAGNFLDSIALDSKISFPFDSSGPDSYTLVSLPSEVPEPSSLVLLGTGVLGVAGMLRRRFGAGSRS